MMNSRAHNMEFEWNDETSFRNIISALLNNWPEMKLAVDRTSRDSRGNVFKNIKKFIQNIFNCVLIYGTSHCDIVVYNIKTSMFDDFHMVIEDAAAKELGTCVSNMFDKWIKQDNLTENRKQIIEEIKNLPKPNPIVKFEDQPRFKLIFETEEIMC